MSTTGASLRTIWIEIRAVNYAVNVLNDVLRQLNGVQLGQDATAMSCFNMAKAALSAGVLFGILGQQLGGTYGQFLQYASYAMYAVAAIEAVTGALKAMSVANIAAAQYMLTVWAPVIAPIVAFTAVFLALKGILGDIPALIAAIVAACLAFIAALIVINALGGRPLLDFAGAIGNIGGLVPHQMGTRQVAETGPALLHKGEIVYNPSTNRPTGYAPTGAGGGMVNNDNSMNIGTVNTKMDTEELADMVKKQQRTMALNNR